MASVPEENAALLVAYEIAIDALPPLIRVVFLLHRCGELNYGMIVARLDISVVVVEQCMA